MMKTSATLVIICYLFVTNCVGSIWIKAYVKINNILPPGTILIVHCKSKEDDLGIHHITGSWGFSFIPHFFDGTMFSCSFAWPGEFHWFDIYVQSRDQEKCTQCIWEISPQGPCRWNGLTGEFNTCYFWSPSSKLW
ncbi:hypothetical protein ACJRO7_026464 [Eucalyptus globulus]|uniref:S-protein homolog n=1 Tax=Eucalyptus globulus TaxID=34317 RepID=A0ABD3JP44_EUCGL